MSAPRIAIATNNGDIGGGEVMLLQIAEALRDLGIVPVILGPTGPGELVAEARRRGFETIALPAEGRRAWMLALAAWRLRNLRIPLWCNGLVPSLATVGLGPRIVHLHQVPRGGKSFATRIAQLGAARTLAISRHMAAAVPGAVPLLNWTSSLQRVRRARGAGQLRIGFLGRVTADKGVHVLAEAVRILRAEGRDAVLVLGGETRHSGSDGDALIEAALRPLEGQVVRLGWVAPEEFFQEVDVAVFPSVAEEGFGLVAAEAMAAGVPFVVSDAGALPEVAGEGYPWVARRGDAEDLARVIADLLSRLDADVPDIVADSRRRWEREFCPAAGQLRVAELLQSLATPPAPRNSRSQREPANRGGRHG